jgi:hypothetical protein
MALIETSIEVGHHSHPEQHDISFYKAPPVAYQLAEGVIYDSVAGTYSGPPHYKPQEVHVSLAPLPQKVEVSLGNL